MIPKLALPMTIALALATASCSDEPRVDTFVYTDIVSLDNTGPEGSVFTAASGQLSAPGINIDTEVLPLNQCLALRYTISGDEPGATIITPIGYSAISNISTTAGSISDYPDYDTQPIAFRAAWTIGNRHLIIRAGLPYDPEPRLLTLLADTSAIADGDLSAVTDLYLIHRRPETTPTFVRDYYIAADISAISADSDRLPRTIRLHFANSIPGAPTCCSITLR